MSQVIDVTSGRSLVIGMGVVRGIGPAGPQGAAGPSGLQGPPGSTGPVGSTGAINDAISIFDVDPANPQTIAAGGTLTPLSLPIRTIDELALYSGGQILSPAGYRLWVNVCVSFSMIGTPAGDRILRLQNLDTNFGWEVCFPAATSRPSSIMVTVPFTITAAGGERIQAQIGHTDTGRTLTVVTAQMRVSRLGTGPQGSSGIQGSQGIPGPQGNPGPAGPAGNSNTGFTPNYDV